MSDYIVILKVRDDRSGRARREVKAILTAAVREAEHVIRTADDLYLQDITVAEVQ
jgi:hypothetical protein